MKNDKLIPGLILVLIGVVILLDNMGYIDFYWDDIWRLWPLFLIVAGVNLVFAHTHSALSTALRVTVVIAAFLFVMVRYGGLGERIGFKNHASWRHDRDHDNDDPDDNDDHNNSGDDDDNDSTDNKGVVKIEDNNRFNMPYTSAAKTAELNISGGASEYTLSDTTNQMFVANTDHAFGKYEFWNHNDGSNYVHNFELNNDKDFHWHSDHNKSSSAVFKLNINPVWDINVETSAAELNFDLTKFKIHQVKIEGAAASFHVKMGEPLESTNIKISNVAVSNTISIPKDAACKIETSTIFSSNNFTDEGFQKKDGGAYTTPGFDAAKNKIYINVDGIAGSFKIHRY